MGDSIAVMLGRYEFFPATFLTVILQRKFLTAFAARLPFLALFFAAEFHGIKLWKIFQGDYPLRLSTARRGWTDVRIRPKAGTDDDEAEPETNVAGFPNAHTRELRQTILTTEMDVGGNLVEIDFRVWMKMAINEI